MSNVTCGVVGVQYYHIAALFIQAYKPLMARPGFEFLKVSREREVRADIHKIKALANLLWNAINANLGTILGLTLGNPKVQNGWFSSSHILSSCKYSSHMYPKINLS
jgi:hypothetical protein